MPDQEAKWQITGLKKHGEQINKRGFGGGGEYGRVEGVGGRC